MIMGKLRRLNKEIVVAAAAELANRRSTADLTLTELAAVLNVRVPSLYNHIAGLDGMRRDLALFGLRDLLARLIHGARISLFVGLASVMVSIPSMLSNTDRRVQHTGMS